MEIVLIASALLLSWFAMEGFRQGVIRRAIEVVGLVAIFLLASGLAAKLQPWLVEKTNFDAQLCFYLSWTVVLLGGFFAVRLLAEGIGKAVQISVVGWLDRTGGILLGLLLGSLSLSCLLIALTALPISEELSAEIQEHPFTGNVLHLAPSLYDQISDLWEGEDFFEAVKSQAEGIRS